MKTRAFIASVGARTPLGRSAMQTGFLLRTGVAAIAAVPLVDVEGEQITMCFDPTLDPYLTGDERAALLAGAALEEALAPLGDAALTMSQRLMLCMDQPYSGGSGSASGPSAPTPPYKTVEKGQITPGALLYKKLELRLRELAPNMSIEMVARGSASAAFALAKGLEALAARQVDLLVVGGAHSDYDPAVMTVLQEQKRLFSPKNLDSFIPGECAAFAVVTREETARKLNLEATARIAGVGTGVAKARSDNDESAYDAAALVSAVRAASEELSEGELRAGWALTDLAFEMRRVHEWQTMITRTHKLWGDPYHVDSPAQRLGHTGCASMPLALVLASEGWKRGFAPSAIAMAFAGSDGGERGAILMFSNL